MVVCIVFSIVEAIGFDISLGNALNLSSQLNINKSVGSTLESLSVTPDTRGFKNPQYYSLRFMHTQKTSAENVWSVELELIHHKLYLDEGLPDYISSLEFTDGYNLLMGNFVFKKDHIGYRLGVGALITHPDVTIVGDEVGLSCPKRIYKRGGGLVPLFSKESGYQLSGFSFQFSSFIERVISDRLKVVFEIKAVPTFMTSPNMFSYRDDLNENQNLSVKVSNLSIHFLGGISFGK